jgi:hypothetical protein
LAEKPRQEAEIARFSDENIQCIFDFIYDIIFRVFDLIVLDNRSVRILRERRCSAPGNESAAHTGEGQAWDRDTL